MSPSDQPATESTPLLIEAPSDNVSPLLASSASTKSKVQPSSSYTTRNSTRIIFFIALCLWILEAGTFLTVAPQLTIFEEIICTEYYTALGGQGLSAIASETVLDADRRCKIAPVQARLALVTGWMETFDNVPGILLALPYGILADRIGRRSVLMLALFGLLLSQVWIRLVCWFSPALPINVVWFSSLAFLLGGGAQVAASMLFTIVADVCPPEKRASAFSMMHISMVVAEIFFTPMSAAMITLYGAWVPWLAVVPLFAIGMLMVAFCVPETLQQGEDTDGSHVTDLEAIVQLTDEGFQPPIVDPGHVVGMKHAFANLRQTIQSLCKDINIILVLIVFFVSYLGRSAAGLVLQYASKRYDWTIAEASYLITLRATFDLFSLVVLLPTCTAYLERRCSTSPAKRDKMLTQGSISLLLVGFLMLFFAFHPAIIALGLVISACGASFAVSARSLITQLVKPDLIATVFTAVGTASYGGLLVSGPILAATFKWGMHSGDFWMGLPFLVAAGLCFVALVSISLTRIRV